MLLLLPMLTLSLLPTPMLPMLLSDDEHDNDEQEEAAASDLKTRTRQWRRLRR